jgi:hypothetical protein
MEGKPTVSQKPYRGRKIPIATLLVVEEDFKAELKLLFEVFLRALFLVRKRASALLNSDFNRFYSTTILPPKHRDT